MTEQKNTKDSVRTTLRHIISIRLTTLILLAILTTINCNMEGPLDCRGGLVNGETYTAL